MAAKMTLGQWKRALGPAVDLEAVPALVKLPVRDVADAVVSGRLRLHTFRAGDGRVFRMVRLADLHVLRNRPKPPQLTMQGLARAFRIMASKPQVRSTNRSSRMSARSSRVA